MSRTVTAVTPELGAYITSVSLRETDLLRRLRDETASHPEATCQITAEQGQFMALLIRMLGAKKTLEVGVFTGYSSIVVAQALPPDGQVIACDISEDFTATARRYWKEAGLENKIQLRIGPAVETLEKLLAEGHAGSFDFAFIDADKKNYRNYYERALELVRVGGLVAIDNTLWHARVIDASYQDADTLAIRELNEFLHHDERVELSLVSVGDGLTLAMKR